MQAATHAAGGVGATVGPRIHAARDAVAPTADRVRGSASQGVTATMATLAPLAVAAADGARQARRATRKAKTKNMKNMKNLKVAKRTAMPAMKAKLTPSKRAKHSRRRWPMIVGVLAAGAAIGTIAVRRRQAAQWEEYDPGQALDTMRAAGSATHESVTPKPADGGKPHGDPISAMDSDPTTTARNGQA